ncbi:MAG: ATP-grasp domain-containing protein [Candidatus Helarchaeota archaeon]|nr:ATP-grasp domain-containing protein [Candidatus Helarchaeota archaeon]
MNKILTVMVTGVGGGGIGEQILKALRLADNPYEIVGCDISSYSSGLKKVDHPYVVPPARDQGYIEVILEICRKHAVKALFSGSEPELLILCCNREIFKNEGILLAINPNDVISICTNKSRTTQFLEENGFFYPTTMILRNLGDLNEWDHFPAVVKPSVGSGGSNNCFIVQTPRELETLATYLLEANVSSELIAQEYVGTPESEYTVGVLFDIDGNLLNSIALRRDLRSVLSCRMKVPNRTGLEEYGSHLVLSTGISQGEIGLFPDVTDYCEKVAAKLGARGTINVQCRLHQGKVYIFEINPRFSGTTSFRAMVGYNEPDILIRKHVLGENIAPRFAYKYGVITRGLEESFFEKITP